MKLDILLSTMHMKCTGEIKKLNISGNCIVVNQCDEEKVETILIKETSAKQTILYTKERGLSKSRNMALFASDADICKLSDDDLKYEENYETLILQAFRDYPKADVICFHVKRPEREKTTFLKPKKLDYLTSLKVCSVEIAFRKERLDGIQFREDFGTGSQQYLMGEENIFLYDCLKKNLKVIYLPVTIGSLLESESTWDTGFHKEFFVSRGANYYAMSRIGSHALIWQYALRKIGEYKGAVTFSDAISSMYQGRKQMKQKDILLIGDYYSTTGPAIVTRDYIRNMPSSVRIIKSRKKLLRLIELIIKLNRSNIILCSGLSKQNVIAFKHARKRNKKSAYLMHGSVAYENEINQIDMPEMERLELEVLQMADRVIAVSDLFKNWVRNHYVECQKKVDAITNGIDWKVAEKSGVINENFSSRTENKIVKIMSVGGGMPRKNIRVLCRAIEEIHSEKNLDFELLVFGENGKDSEIIRGYSFVKDFGVCSHDQLLNYMKTVDIYVQNSSFETFGLAPIEAALMGCSVIISSKVGAKDVLQDVFGLKKEQIVEDTLDVAELINAIENLLCSQSIKAQPTLLRKYEMSVQKRSMELFHYLGQIGEEKYNDFK